MERDDPAEAMEYVLGLMDARERRAFELALLDDPDLAAEVWRIEDSLAPLSEALPPRTPPRRVFRGVERRLFPGEPAARPTASRMAVAFWRLVASILGVAVVGAAALIAVLVMRPETLLPQEPPYIAALVAEDGQVTLARLTRDGVLIAAPFAGALGGGRDPELWAVTEGEAPRSLGVLSQERPIEVPLLSLVPDGPGAVRLVVTSEPEGGSPTGQPTGPAIAEGALRQI